jgi:hypothetical protein
MSAFNCSPHFLSFNRKKNVRKRMERRPNGSAKSGRSRRYRRRRRETSGRRYSHFSKL